MKLYCQNGCQIEGRDHYKTREFERAPDETSCPECGGRLLTGMERNARKKAAKRNGRLRDQPPAESAAAEEFHGLVCTPPLCWASLNRPDHRCSGRLEAHHLIEAQWWRRVFGDLDEAALLALVYNPLIGAPLCGGFHGAVTAKRERIYFTELDRELIEHCERLDLQYPGRGVLARLEHECPIREAAA